MRYLQVLAMIGVSLPVAPSVLVTEARNLSTLLNNISAHRDLGRTTAYGVALDYECTGFKK